MDSSSSRLGARFWALIGATFLGFLGIGSVLPALAPHVRHELGGSDQTVGLVIGTFSFVALVARFISGQLTDRRGRKVAFLIGLTSCAASGAAYLLPLGLEGAYLGRTLQGFGEACLYTGAAAWVIELAGVQRSAEALGYLSSGIWGGISVGPVVGHWLGSFERAAALQVVAAVVAMALLAQVPEDYKPGQQPQRRRWLPSSMLAPGLAVGFVNVHYPVITGFLILHLARYGNSGPAAFSVYALLILASRFFLGRLPDRIDPSITFYGGLVSMAAALSVLAAGPKPVYAIAATALLGFGFSFPWSAVASSVLRAIPSGERGSVIGVLSAFVDLFVGISSFAAGAIANRAGYAATFVLATGALIAAAVAGRIVFGSRQAPDTPGEPGCPDECLTANE
jgi:MFS family permease